MLRETGVGGRGRAFQVIAWSLGPRVREGRVVRRSVFTAVRTTLWGVVRVGRFVVGGAHVSRGGRRRAWKFAVLRF